MMSVEWCACALVASSLSGTTGMMAYTSTVPSISTRGLVAAAAAGDIVARWRIGDAIDCLAAPVVKLA